MKRAMIVAGEASGDLHAANLVRELYRLNPAVHVYGMGGGQLRAAGAKILIDSTKLAVVGLWEVLAHYREIKQVLGQLQSSLRDDPPDLLILVDYAEFNLKLAKTARELGIKVFFYISPQVWAWREKRVRKIKERVDLMGVLFPFEADFYRKHDVPVEYVGHPLIDHVEAGLSPQATREMLGLDADEPVVALLPGSRKSEISRLMPLMNAAVAHIGKEDPRCRFVLPIAPGLERELIVSHLEDPERVVLVEGHAYDVMQIARAAIVASGTATLECALMGTPMAIVYRVAPLSYFLFKRLIRIPFVGLVNVIGGREMAAEFIQDRATAGNVGSEVLRLLRDESYHAERRALLQEVRERLGSGGGARNAAAAALSLLT